MNKADNKKKVKEPAAEKEEQKVNTDEGQAAKGKKKKAVTAKNSANDDLAFLELMIKEKQKDEEKIRAEKKSKAGTVMEEPEVSNEEGKKTYGKLGPAYVEGMDLPTPCAQSNSVFRNLRLELYLTCLTV